LSLVTSAATRVDWRILGVDADAQDFVDFVEDEGAECFGELFGEVEDFAFAFLGDFVLSVFELNFGQGEFASGTLSELQGYGTGELKEHLGFAALAEGFFVIPMADAIEHA